ncbi:MAG TPA: DUF4180 domain-containing protein [Actinomycetospora sp.]|jgi:hypothetical protein|uniref:DUF4180 domain-containing protein n=1 Tax=Actinomycetospora sp. TaxID=1872135 RepID=UPI002F4242E2
MVETEHGVRVFAVPPQGAPTADESAALDVIGDAFGAGAEVVSVPVARLTPELHTGVAGAIVQKFVNYGLFLVVVGEPHHHGPTSGPVDDWMREANQGRELWFVADEAELDRRLTGQS